MSSLVMSSLFCLSTTSGGFRLGTTVPWSAYFLCVCIICCIEWDEIVCLFDSLDSLCTRCVTLCMMCVCTVIDTLYSCIIQLCTIL